MDNPKATAHALATIGGLSYIICAAWVMLARDTFMNFFTMWAHSVNLTALPASTPGIGNVVIGFITFTGAAWITGYLFAVTYNYFDK